MEQGQSGVLEETLRILKRVTRRARVELLQEQRTRRGKSKEGS